MSLPRHIFENKEGAEQVASESEVFYLQENITFDNGIQVWLRGAEYPQKGTAPANVLFDFNIAKRIMAEGLKIVSKLPVVVGFMLGQAVLPKRHKLSIAGVLAAYNSILWKVLSPHMLKGEYMTPCAYEIRKFSYVFLREIGVCEHDARQFSSIASHFIEYDNAYRYRVQDLIHDTDLNDLSKDPQNVIKRYIRLSKERDSDAVSGKITAGIRLLSLVLRLPKYKNAFREALTFIEFDKMKFDEVDIYWISMRTDYPYLGEEADVRSKRNEGKGIPIPMPQHEFDEYVAKLRKKNNDIMIMRSIDVLLKDPKYREIISNKLKE